VAQAFGATSQYTVVRTPSRVGSDQTVPDAGQSALQPVPQ
jgi:hypothetical protein